MIRPLAQMAAVAGRPRPIVIVRTGEPVASVAVTRGQFDDLIVESLGAQASDFAVFDIRTEAPPAPDAARAFIITGSSSNVPLREAWMLRAEAWLRDVVREDVPTFGICFGHQLLAQALGGEVQKNPRGREMGTVRIECVADDPLLENAPRSFEANATHVDSVVALPAGAVALARSELDPHQAIRFSASCYGVQFHPEMDAGVMRAYIEARRAILESERFVPDEMLARVTDAPSARNILRRFWERVMRPRAGRANGSPSNDPIAKRDP